MVPLLETNASKDSREQDEFQAPILIASWAPFSISCGISRPWKTADGSTEGSV